MKTSIQPLLKATPEALFTGIHPRAATEQELWAGSPAIIDGPRSSGCLPFDRFTAIVHRDLHRATLRRVSAQLNVNPADFRGMVRCLTGLTPEEWVEGYVVLVVLQMLSDPSVSMKQIIQRTGYSRNGLHQLMVRMGIERRFGR